METFRYSKRKMKKGYFPEEERLFYRVITPQLLFVSNTMLEIDREVGA